MLVEKLHFSFEAPTSEVWVHMFFVLFFGSMENLYKPPHLKPSRMEYEALVCTTPSKGTLGGVNWTLVQLHRCTTVFIHSAIMGRQSRVLHAMVIRE